MIYFLDSPRINRAAINYLCKYGDGRSEALSDLQQLLFAERERGIRDALADVCAFLREADTANTFEAVYPNATRVVRTVAKYLDHLYANTDRLVRVLRPEMERP